MKNILYLTNYIGEDIIEKRNNKAVFSQAANNKVIGIARALKSVGCNVIILSSGIVNNKTCKYYREIENIVDGIKIIYTKIVDFPLVNTLSSAKGMCQTIKAISKENHIDGIIFYNFKPEVALAALWAKRKLKVPVYVEYEDGYSDLTKSFKSFILRITEKITKPYVDKAIIVNKIAEREFAIPCVTVRGVIDSDYFEKCIWYEKQPNKKVTILYSGGLNEKRGINVLLDSLQYLDIDFEVWITGGSKLEVSDSRVKFLGFLDYSKVQELMMQADILVQCQLTSCSFANQSFPSKIFEYLPTGNVIVSSNLEDVKSFAGDAFIYYENDDAQALAMALKKATMFINNKRYKKQLNALCSDNLPESVGKRLLNLFEGE